MDREEEKKAYELWQKSQNELIRLEKELKTAEEAEMTTRKAWVALVVKCKDESLPKGYRQFLLTEEISCVDAATEARVEESQLEPLKFEVAYPENQKKPTCSKRLSLTSTERKISGWEGMLVWNWQAWVPWETEDWIQDIVKDFQISK